MPATPAQTDISEAGVGGESEEQPCEQGALEVETPIPVTRPPVSPAHHTTPPVSPARDVGTTPAPVSSPTIPLGTVPATPAACDPPLQYSLFGATSPLTQMSSPQPAASLEDPISTPSPESAGRKRKREPSRRDTVKGSRRSKRSRPQGNKEVASYPVTGPGGGSVDPSILPPVEGRENPTGENEDNQLVSLIGFFSA